MVEIIQQFVTELFDLIELSVLFVWGNIFKVSEKECSQSWEFIHLLFALPLGQARIAAKCLNDHQADTGYRIFVCVFFSFEDAPDILAPNVFCCAYIAFASETD